MRVDAAILAVSLALMLAGCVFPGRTKTAQAVPPAPVPTATAESSSPPQPLSVPQTHVELPSSQPLDPAALTTAEPEPPQVELPPAQARTNRRVPSPRTVAAPKPDTPSPVQAAPEPERQPIQEVTTPDERKRLQDSAELNKREARAYLDQARGRGLSQQEKDTAQSIEQLLRSSDDSQSKGDMRTANDLAYKAMILARDLQNVR